MIGVLAVDDHVAVRLGLRALLDAAEGVSLVGEAGDKREAMRLIRERRPDVLLLDLRLSGGADGLDICREVRTLSRPPRVLVHTAVEGAEGVTASALAGADGYVSKDSEPSDLVGAIKRAYAGERVWLEGLERLARATEPERAKDSPLLTPKEREVYALKLRRYPNAQIARELFITERTVKAHVSSIMRKLGRTGRGSLA